MDLFLEFGSRTEKRHGHTTGCRNDQPLVTKLKSRLVVKNIFNGYMKEKIEVVKVFKDNLKIIEKVKRKDDT